MFDNTIRGAYSDMCIDNLGIVVTERIY